MRAPRPQLTRLVLGGALLGVLAWIYRDMAVADLTNWDDDRFLAYNPLFDAGGWTYASAAVSRIQFEAYQPLHLLSYLPDRYLWPHWPAGFHLLNLALFAADLVVLWQLVRRYTSELAAFVALALFALHPLCVEPVAWVTSRKDLVMMLFFLLAIGREDQRARVRPDPWALVLFLCALLTKSASVCFPVVLFAWLVWLRGRPVREAVLRSAIYAIAAIAVSLFVFAVWSDRGMVAGATPGERVVDVAASAVMFARHTLWPSDLAPLYPDHVATPTAAVIGCIAALLALAISWRWLPARARFAVVAAIGVLLPVSNIIPMSLRFADRYLFIALALLVLPVASAFDGLVDHARAHARRAALAIAIGAAVIAGLEVRLSAQLAPTWQSSQALWSHAVDAQPEAFLAHLKYAETLETAHDWPAALAQLRTAHKVNPMSILPLKRMFMLDVDRAESRGVVPTGATVQWVTQLDHAMADRAAFDQLASVVDSSPCRTCGNALLLVQLASWPQSDAQLLASARAAIDRRAWDRAYVYLAQVSDQTLPELGELAHRVATKQ